MAQKAADIWLNEQVATTGEQTISRRKAVHTLARGLHEFMKGSGYRLLLGVNDLSSGIATVMYHNRAHRLTGPYVFERQYGYSDEHIQHYNHIVDRRAWEAFWDAWGFWDDVSLDSPLGYFRRLDIQEYVWTQIDLEASPQGRIVEAWLNTSEEPQIIHEEDYALTHF
jgi:hypothetical protein